MLLSMFEGWKEYVQSVFPALREAAEGVAEDPVVDIEELLCFRFRSFLKNNNISN